MIYLEYLNLEYLKGLTFIFDEFAISDSQQNKKGIIIYLIKLFNGFKKINKKQSMFYKYICTL